MNVEQLKNSIKKDYEEMNAAIQSKSQKKFASKKRIDTLKVEVTKLEGKRKVFILGTVKSKVSGMFKNESVESIDQEITRKKQAIKDEEKTLSLLEEIQVHELYDFEKIVSSAEKVSKEQQKVIGGLKKRVFEIQLEYKQAIEDYKDGVNHHNTFVSTVKSDITKHLPVKTNTEVVYTNGRGYLPGTYEMLDFPSINKLNAVTYDGFEIRKRLNTLL